MYKCIEREGESLAHVIHIYIYIYVYEGRGDRGTSYADGWSEKGGADREEEEPGRGGARGEGNIYIEREREKSSSSLCMYKCTERERGKVSHM